jgi:4-aminobutyrate aminotransferase
MARQPIIRTELPGPKAAAVIRESEEHVSSSYTRDYPLVAASGSGCWITDPDGNEFLDVTAGIAVTATGHCHPEVVAAARAQLGSLLHMSGTDFYYPTQARLAKALCPTVPIKGGNTQVYFGNSGAEAVECALKLARWHTGRPYFIAFLNAFHGRTMGALSLTASKVIQKAAFGPFVPGVTHAIYPDPYRHGGEEEATRVALDSLHTLFRTKVPPGEVAAIFVEPLQGEGGYIVPPNSFLVGLRELCDEHGILLVFDEIQCGMGRTGKLWCCEHSGVEPDILTSAKGIASGLPLSATFASADVMRWPPGSHASTFGGNPVACAAALKTLELLQSGLVDNSAAVGEHLLAALRERLADHPRIGEIRGRGLMVGVEIVTDRSSKTRDSQLRNTLVTDCFYRGLLILGCGPNTIRFSPALVLSREEADVAVEIFTEALQACA